MSEQAYWNDPEHWRELGRLLRRAPRILKPLGWKRLGRFWDYANQCEVEARRLEARHTGAMR